MRDGTALHDLPDLSRDEEEDGVEKEDKDDPLVVGGRDILAVTSVLVGDAAKVLLISSVDRVSSVKPAVLVNHIQRWHVLVVTSDRVADVGRSDTKDGSSQADSKGDLVVEFEHPVV